MNPRAPTAVLDWPGHGARKGMRYDCRRRGRIWCAQLGGTVQLRSVEGTALFYYTVNRDPAFWGFDLLGLPFDLAGVRGFPVFLAKVAFPVPGYRALVG